MDSTGGGGVAAQVDHPGAADVPRGARQGWHARLPGRGARGGGHGGVVRVACRRIDDQQQV
jgi:hypothetical protein